MSELCRLAAICTSASSREQVLVSGSVLCTVVSCCCWSAISIDFWTWGNSASSHTDGFSTCCFRCSSSASLRWAVGGAGADLRCCCFCFDFCFVFLTECCGSHHCCTCAGCDGLSFFLRRCDCPFCCALSAQELASIWLDGSDSSWLVAPTCSA